MMFENFIEEYKKIEDKPFWIITKNPVYETVIEPGGYDHLGCLPDKKYDVLRGYEHRVEKRRVSPYTIKLLITEEYWLDEESANWVALSRNQKEAKNNGKINKNKRPMGM